MEKYFFILAYTLLVENQVKDLRYKIFFRFVLTNNILYKMKNINTPNCHMCLTEVQTIENLFYEC